MKNNISIILDELKNSKIDEMHINTKDKKINVQLTNQNDEKISFSFDDVNTYLYIDEDLNKKDLSPTLLTGPISFYSNGYGEFVSVEEDSNGIVSESYVAFPNFLIDLPESSMLVESQIITVDGHTYNLKGYSN